MHGYWSLVIFTLLGQAAAGMLILSFFSRTADTSRAKAWAACILLGVGALASLEHLSDPTVSFYTITNVGTSWLSREILFVGLFGAGLLLWLITLNAWARRLAAILGLAFVYVMSRVYIIPTEPFWNSLLTFWSFLSTAFLLGASLLLLLDELGAKVEDLEGIVSIPRRIEGVDVAVAFRENPSGTYKISVRTGEKANASAICENFGGGGHVRAAGCNVPGPLEHAKELLLEAVRKELTGA